jgi:signal transduction histidine kinase
MVDEPSRAPDFLTGISVRLIATIIVVIMVVEVVIYLPSVSNFRANWLGNKLSVGVVAARVLDVVPDAMKLPEELTDRLLTAAGAVAIAYRREGQSQLIERTDVPMPMAEVTADMRFGDPVHLIGGALDVLFFGSDRTTRVIGSVPGTDSLVELLINEAPLRADMLIYSRNIFILSLIVALITAVVIFVVLNRSLIRPIRRLIGNMMSFRREPENATLIIDPTPRRDEIGVMERELSSMETDLFAMLRQRRHLADLGLGVAKINHDLRNILTSAQLLSDQVATLDDPKVQRLAPRLVQTLDRATSFAQSVIDYGRESAAPPKPQPVDLHALIDEAAVDAGLAGHPRVRCVNAVPDNICLRVDPDQLARVLINLIRNAREALETPERTPVEPTITCAFADDETGLAISVSDNGPGLPPRARQNLFIAFDGSARAGGTGLGLAIARELTEAHGGHLVYEPLDPGTRFVIRLPASARLSRKRG